MGIWLGEQGSAVQSSGIGPSPRTEASQSSEVWIWYHHPCVCARKRAGYRPTMSQSCRSGLQATQSDDPRLQSQVAHQNRIAWRALSQVSRLQPSSPACRFGIRQSNQTHRMAPRPSGKANAGLSPRCHTSRTRPDPLLMYHPCDQSRKPSACQSLSWHTSYWALSRWSSTYFWRSCRIFIHRTRTWQRSFLNTCHLGIT